MKIKTLFAVVVVLAVASAAVYFLGRPPKPAAADPRLGQPLVAASVVEQAARITVVDAGRTVTLKKGSDGAWTVAEYHDFAADFPKLSRLAGDLTAAKLERLVSQSAERIKGFGFDTTRIAFADATDKELATVHLGKTAEGGGRLVRFGEENKAFLARFSAFLDTEPRNWADAAVVPIKSEDVAKVEVGFADGAAVVASRAKKEDPFAAADAPEGQVLRASRIDSLLSSLTSLRFTDTTEPADANAVAARAGARTVKLTTFGGATVTVALGRKPEQKVIKAPEAKKDGSTGPAALGSVADLAKGADPVPAAGAAAPAAAGADAGPAKAIEPAVETIPAGPVFAFVTHSDAAARINAAMAKRAFQVFESAFTGLPQARADLFEPAPAPAAAPTPSATPSAAPSPAPAPTP